MKITKSSLVQKLVLLVHTWSKELVPLVQGGHLRFEHDRVLLRQAKSAGVGGGVEGGVLLQDFPPDVELPPLVLQLPHIAGQGGADPLVTVLHVGLVAAVPFLPWWFCHPHIELVGLALLHHGGLVLDLVVEASGAVHGAVGCPSSAVAVLVARQLFRQLVRHLLQQSPVVGGDDGPHVGHRPIRELHRVTVGNPPEDVADRDALVQDVH